MMKIDSQNSAECQNWDMEDKMVNLEFVLNELNDKITNSVVSYI